MTTVTLRILDGADRGRILEDLPTPLSIGREEGNSLQLNDERVSRFHLKIQTDDGKLVLTDLESTNGTRVNGEPVQLWVLRPGDVVALGRTVLLVGSREEIAQRLAKLRQADMSQAIPMEGDELEPATTSPSLDLEMNYGNDPESLALLRALAPPELPTSLNPGQTAQLAELLQYFQLRLRWLTQTVKKARGERVTLEQRQWQFLLDMYDRLASYLYAIGEPRE